MELLQNGRAAGQEDVNRSWCQLDKGGESGISPKETEEEEAENVYPDTFQEQIGIRKRSFLISMTFEVIFSESG